jgi:hypothetical protein
LGGMAGVNWKAVKISRSFVTPCKSSSDTNGIASFNQFFFLIFFLKGKNSILPLFSFPTVPPPLVFSTTSPPKLCDVSVPSDNNNNGRLFICADVSQKVRKAVGLFSHVSPSCKWRKITINNRKNDEGAVDGWIYGWEAIFIERLSLL